MTANAIGNIEVSIPTLTEIETNPDALIPKPAGYHILICMPQASSTYGDSGIVKATTSVHRESILSMVGLVVDMGDQAYSDKDRFPNGPWCKQGDYVMFRSNSGTRFRVDGAEMRLINDDSVEAVIVDPSAITTV